MNIIVQTFLGLLALVGGVALLYFFMAGLSTGVNFLFLIISLVLIGVGSFLFFRVSKIANSSPELTQASTKETSKQANSKLLERNNQIAKDWAQLNSKKDTLKSVQMAVSAEVQAKADQQ